MKKKIFWVGLVILLGIGFGIWKLVLAPDSKYLSDQVGIPFERYMTLSVGDSVLVSDNKNYEEIVFKAVTQDNRCPIDVECIEGGEISVHLQFIYEDGTEDVFMSSGGVPQQFKNYLISITDIKPGLYSDRELVQSDYSISFDFNRLNSDDFDNIASKSDLVRLFNPRPLDTLGTKVEINGEARGTWFFEATFPVRIEDSNGKVIASHYVQANGEWMTENFVPFNGSIELGENIPAGKGYLILEKSNPSGLIEHADELRVPILFW